MLVLCLTSLSLPEPAVARRERERDRQTGREGERGGNGWKAVLSLCVESSNLWSPLISLPQRLIVGRIAQDRKETSGDTSGGRGEKDRQQLLEEETETVFGRLRGHCEGRDGELKQSRWGKKEQERAYLRLRGTECGEARCNEQLLLNLRLLTKIRRERGIGN